MGIQQNGPEALVRYVLEKKFMAMAPYIYIQLYIIIIYMMHVYNWVILGEL